MFLGLVIQPTSGAAAQAQVADLVRQLSEISKPGAGYGEQLLWDLGGPQFLPTPQNDVFHGKVMRVWTPKVAPALLELIKIGRPALPMLLAHLTDTTPTKLDLPTHGTSWLTNSYDPRVRAPYSEVLGWTPPPSWGMFDHLGETPLPGKAYRVRVGDLCYLAIGQIVGRTLEIVSPGYLGDHLHITAPPFIPSVAESARHDWSGLTEAAHIESLIYDTLHDDIPRLNLEAFRRLLFYYPEAAERLAERLLDRTIVRLDGAAQWAYSIVHSPEWTWKGGLDNARRDKGLLWVQACGLFLREGLVGPDLTKSRAVATRAKVEFWPQLDLLRPPMINAISPENLYAIVQLVAKHPSCTIDARIDNAFKRLLAMPFENYTDNPLLDDFAIACAERLSSKGYIEPYRSYFHRRAQQFEPQANYSTVPDRRLDLAHWANVFDRLAASSNRH